MKKKNGFTLVELLIVIGIIGIIMAYGIPSYQRQVIVSKRTEAKTAIILLASELEKHNATFNVYTIEIGGSGTDGDSLGLVYSAFLTSTNYTFSISATDGYTISAVAIASSTQSKDIFNSDDCTTMTLNSFGTKLPLNCWQ